MKPDDQRDQLIDMLLRELVGGEAPPDVRERVLKAARHAAPKPAGQRHSSPSRQVRSLPSVSRSRSRFFAIAAVAAVLAVAAVFVHLREIVGARTPSLSRTTGSVDRAVGALRGGESLRTGAGSSAVLTYPDGTVVELAAETTVRVSERSWRERSKGLALVAGRVRAEVVPQVAGHPMRLTAGNADAEVVGTKLSFRHGDGGTRLEVEEGAVRFIPRAAGALMVRAGGFAEAVGTQVTSGALALPLRRGIVRFTLMNADTDKPLREAALNNGETISLASLPTQNINLRADYEGDAPASVRILVVRHDGQSTGLSPSTSADQIHPPFFAAGDHWPERRPNDCRAWTPRPGRYRISAEASYAGGTGADHGKALEMEFRITE
jgi:hypothetical protein